MNSFQQVAVKVAKQKAGRPELYCPVPRCLWRTNGGYCPRHSRLEVPSDVRRHS